MRRLLTPHHPLSDVRVFTLDAGWRLHPQVAVRPEPFGALLYHFGTRRLSFLKDAALTDAVRALPEHPTARAACAAAGIITDLDDPVPADVVSALETLARTGMIEPTTGPVAGSAG